MDHYVSTYKSDYTWPQMSCTFPPLQVADLKVAALKVAKTTARNCVDSQKSLEKLLQMYWEPRDKNSTGRTDQSLKLYLIKGEDKPETVNTSE